MGLDIRWPIGIIFTLYGAILIFFGAVTNPAIFERSLGVNIDVWWGAAERLLEHYEAPELAGRKRVNRALFRRQCE